jgi:hypothetical protein
VMDFCAKNSVRPNVKVNICQIQSFLAIVDCMVFR